MSSFAELPRPEAVVLDLDGVLADIYSRKALASVEDLAAIAATVPVAVVTTCPQSMARSVLELHGFAAHIKAVIGSEDGPNKPSPAPVRLALERLGKPRCPAWMLGDNPTDVQSAKAAGVVALAVDPHGIGGDSHRERLRQAGAERLVAGVAELRLMLAEFDG